ESKRAFSIGETTCRSCSIRLRCCCSRCCFGFMTWSAILIGNIG
ncbi:hypothetical protein CP8484711_0655, partial [Chlamydia psittaci 84-8471/1]